MQVETRRGACWIYLGKSHIPSSSAGPNSLSGSESNQLCGIRVPKLVVFSCSRSVLQLDHRRNIYLSLDEVFLSALGSISDGEEDCFSISWEVVSAGRKRGEIWKCGSCYVAVSFCVVGLKKGCPKAKLNSAVFSVIMSFPHEYITS